MAPWHNWPQGAGLGGKELASSGVGLLSNITGESLIGFSEAVKKYFSFRKLFKKKVVPHLKDTKPDLVILVEPVYRQEAAAPTPTDSPVVEVLARAIKAVKGLEAKPMGIGGGTVAAFFRKAGLPARPALPP